MKKLILSLLTIFIFQGVAMASGDKNIIIIDVRTPAEFSEGQVPGALNIDFRSPDFQSKILKLDKNKSYKLYCRSGNRSGQAMGFMSSQGFKQVENLGSLQEALNKLKLKCQNC